MSERLASESGKDFGGLAILVRVFYLMVGPAVMLMLAARILQSGDGFTGKDIAYLAILLLMPVACGWDVLRWGRGGKSAPEDAGKWRTYSISVLAAGAAVYLALRLLG